MEELAGFIGLGALMVTLFAWMRLDMGRMEARINDRFERVEGRLERVEAQVTTVEGRLTAMEGRLVAVEGRLVVIEGQIAAQSGRITAIEHGQAKLEGLLEGLREAIAIRAATE